MSYRAQRVYNSSNKRLIPLAHRTSPVENFAAKLLVAMRQKFGGHTVRQDE
jgi:6-phosphogluconate dehydrogenase (decarboxylating)